MRDSRSSVVVLGGYGNFGRRIVAALADDAEHRIIIAGRDGGRAAALAQQVGGSAEPLQLDIRAPGLAEALARAGAKLVIHTAGPFQAQAFDVPRACIQARAHYVDLADARDFVCGIHALSAEARRHDTLLVSGASSLPALSSAVIDRLAGSFAMIESIDHAITSGATPPGEATMQGVLAYAGRSFARWQRGGWQQVSGWQDLAWHRFPAPVGMRLLANCDVPDLELFPRRYPSVHSVRFRAGVAQPGSMLAIWMAAWAVRLGLMRSMVPLVPRLHRLALQRAARGSRHSAMRIAVQGRDASSRPMSRTWTLLAADDHGPEIPCFPAIALARKLLRGEVTVRGAMPCMGLLNVQEILDVGRGLSIKTIEE